MPLDHPTLDTLRRQHPAWRLLAAEHAPLVASFLHRVFITPNVRVMAQADLAEVLEDSLYDARQRLGTQAFSGTSPCAFACACSTRPWPCWPPAPTRTSR